MKSNKLIKKKHLEEFDYTNHDECLEAVKQCGLALKFVKTQTHDICMEAVKENPFALVNVEDQTDDICLEAIKQNPYILKYIKKNKQKNYVWKRLRKVV